MKYNKCWLCEEDWLEQFMEVDWRITYFLGDEKGGIFIKLCPECTLSNKGGDY